MQLAYFRLLAIGGIVAVVNRQLGIGVFSPRLDEAGNSVRGQLCCIGLAEDLGLHAFDSTNPGSNFLRAWDHGSNSRR